MRSYILGAVRENYWGYYVASFLQLREAKRALGLAVDNSHLRVIATAEDVFSKRDIVRVLRNADLERTPEDIENLFLVLSHANELAGIASSIEEDDEVELTPKEVRPPVKDETPAEIVEVLDPGDFLDIDLFGGDDVKVQSLEILPGAPGQRTVSWKAPKTSKSIFVLVAGTNEFPRVVRDGHASWISRTSPISITGDFRFFSLFSFAGPGEKGVLVAQGRVLGEITSFECETYSDQIRLRWESDDVSARVSLYRSKPNLALPDNPPASLKIPLNDKVNTYVDQDVKQGQEFEYRVYLEWEGPDGRVTPSAGKKQKAEVTGKILDVKGFKVTRIGTTNYVDIEFDEPETGSVRVFQVKGLPSSDLLRAMSPDMEVDSNRLTDPDISAWLGTEVIDLAKVVDGKVTISKVPLLGGSLDSISYSAVGVLGKKARICDKKVIQQVADISGATLIDRYDYQLLRVELPEGAQSLEIWLKGVNPAQDVSEQGLGKADRTVQVDQEYRRFGGVLFADNVPGFPGLAQLQPEPLSIYVRGISTFEGETHPSPIFKVDYKGRIEVRFKQGQIAAPAAKSGGLFKKAAPEALPSAFAPLQIKVKAPANYGAAPIDLKHFAAPTFPIDEKTPGSLKKPFIRVNPESFKNWENVAIPSPDNGAPQPVMVETNLQFRLSSALADIGGVPIYAIDDRVDVSKVTQVKDAAKNHELNVVLIGAKQSGKTTYVQALLNYFDQQLSQTFSAKLLPIDDTDEIAIQRLKDMHTFVRTGRLPDATRSAQQFINSSPDAPKDPSDPTQSLNFKFFNGGNVPLAAIRLLDVAGEDMDKLATMKYYQDALLRADLIIFLMDPLQLETVRVALAGTPLPPKGTDPFNVLENLTKILTESPEQRNPKQKIAITLSKFDAFEEVSYTENSNLFGVIQKGMQVTRDPNSNANYLYNGVDGALLELEILSILERLDNRPLISLVQNAFGPGVAHYFVVSSLGHSTHAEKMDRAGITSLRISDPIRWALDNH